MLDSLQADVAQLAPGRVWQDPGRAAGHRHWDGWSNGYRVSPEGWPRPLADRTMAGALSVSLNGRAYPKFSLGNGPSDALFLTPTQIPGAGRHLSGVFTTARPRRLPCTTWNQAKFTYFEGICLFRRLRMFYMPEKLSVGEDGLAYDQDGNLFAAALTYAPWTPASSGPDWATTGGNTMNEKSNDEICPKS